MICLTATVAFYYLLLWNQSSSHQPTNHSEVEGDKWVKRENNKYFHTNEHFWKYLNVHRKLLIFPIHCFICRNALMNCLSIHLTLNNAWLLIIFRIVGDKKFSRKLETCSSAYAWVLNIEQRTTYISNPRSYTHTQLQHTCTLMFAYTNWWQ